MMQQTLRIATRNSPLALWQAEHVKKELERHHPDLSVTLLGFTTTGDKLLGAPLAEVGGKGLFVKELEQALWDGKADIAVHSMKDMPAKLPEGLILAAVCERENPADVFLSSVSTCLADLPKAAIVGTSSVRRQAQLLAYRPDLIIKPLRGNVNTRLRKLDDGEYDAIILAAAGLIRLDMKARITEYLSRDICLPAGGQGIIGVQCRKEDQETLAKLVCLDHLPSRIVLSAERALNKRLQGGCQAPVAAYAQHIAGDQLQMEALVAETKGQKILRASLSAPCSEAEALGLRLAEKLLEQGADQLLAEFYRDNA